MRWLKSANLGLGFRFCGDSNKRGESLYVVVTLPIPHGEIIVRFSDHRMVPGGCYSKSLHRRLPQPNLSVDPTTGVTLASAKELVEARLAAATEDATMRRGR